MKKILLNDVNLVSGGNKSSSTEYKPDYDKSTGTLTLHRYDDSNHITLHDVTYKGEFCYSLTAESFDVLKKFLPISKKIIKPLLFAFIIKNLVLMWNAKV